MNKQTKSWVKNTTIVIVILAILSTLLGFFSSLGYLESFRIIFGSIYVLFLPGFIISYIFFPKSQEFESKKEESGAIDLIERVALSFALSIAIVPLAVFYLNLIGLKINLINSSLTILGILIISGIILFYKSKK